MRIRSENERELDFFTSYVWFQTTIHPCELESALFLGVSCCHDDEVNTEARANEQGRGGVRSDSDK